MRKYLAAFLIVLLVQLGLPVSALAHSGGSKGFIVKAAGGSVDAQIGDDVNLRVNSDFITLTALKQQPVPAYMTPEGGPPRRTKDLVLARITPAQITDLSYGTEVHHRVGAGIAVGIVSLGAGLIVGFTKSKKHYIGITWSADGKKGGLAFEAKKGEYRAIISSLETATGKKAVDTDAPGIATRLGVVVR